MAAFVTIHRAKKIERGEREGGLGEREESEKLE